MHFSNYISGKDAKKIVAGGINEITVTKTALKQTPSETISFLNMNDVLVKKLERTGRPRTIDDTKLEQILAMRKSSRLSFKEIGDMIGVPKSTVFDYCRGDTGIILEDGRMSFIERETALSMFNMLLKKDLCDEVNLLAQKGLLTTDVSEMKYLMREIEDIVL